jgi:hypothetical protein
MNLMAPSHQEGLKVTSAELKRLLLSDGREARLLQQNVAGRDYPVAQENHYCRFKMRFDALLLLV